MTVHWIETGASAVLLWTEISASVALRWTGIRPSVDLHLLRLELLLLGTEIEGSIGPRWTGIRVFGNRSLSVHVCRLLSDGRLAKTESGRPVGCCGHCSSRRCAALD